MVGRIGMQPVSLRTLRSSNPSGSQRPLALVVLLILSLRVATEHSLLFLALNILRHKKGDEDSLGCLAIRTRCFHRGVLGSTPGQGTKALQTMGCNQKKKKKKKRRVRGNSNSSGILHML